MVSLTDSAVRIQTLVAIGLETTQIYATDGPYDITVTIGGYPFTFISSKMLTNVDGASTNYFANGNSASVTFQSISNDYASDIGNNFLRRGAFIYKLLSDPLTFAEDSTPYPVFQGTVTGISQIRRLNSFDLTVTIGNELSGFERVNGRFTSEFYSHYNFNNIQWGSTWLQKEMNI